MADYRVPFDQVSPDETPSDFDPSLVLARIVDEGLLEEGAKGTVEGTVETAWGELGAERRGEDEVFLETPSAEVSQRQVMLNVAAMKLGVERSAIEGSHGAIQEIDVGEPVLVCPFASEELLREAPETADPSTVPGVEAEAGIGYAITQRRPYARILGRSWGNARPMTVLAAAATHLVLSEGFRPTYPRTRVVGRLLAHGEEEAEVTVQAREAGHGPVVERVLVGGRVREGEE